MSGAGGLDRLVMIQQASEVPDATGHPVKTWQTIATVPARRRDVRGEERFRAQQTLAEMTSVFTIRWRPGVTAAHRLLEGGFVWDIIGGPSEIGRRRWLEITATAKVV